MKIYDVKNSYVRQNKKRRSQKIFSMIKKTKDKTQDSEKQERRLCP